MTDAADRHPGAGERRLGVTDVSGDSLPSLEQAYRVVFDNSPALIAYVNRDHRFVFANEPYCRFVGRTSGEVAGAHIGEVLSEEAYATAREHIEGALAGNEVQFETQVVPATGSEVWVSATYVPDRAPEGAVRGFFAFILDIDALKREQQQRLTLLKAVDHGAEGFALHDTDGNFSYVNPAQANMYGFEPADLIGKSWRILYEATQVDEVDNVHLPELMRDGQWRGELRGRRRNGELFDVEVSLTVLESASGQPDAIFCSCRDISDRKRAQEQVDYLAYHDHLTGLPNGALFRQRLGTALERAAQSDRMVAVMFIDLDHFKEVNDTLGHSAGDEVLRRVADRVRSVFREEDIVARLGGDEFTVALGELTSRATIESLAGKLMDVFTEPIDLIGRSIHQSASVGISTYPEDGRDADTLMKHADAAMYRAKEDGRNAHSFYTPSLTDRAHELVQLRTGLRSARVLEQLELHYQPLIDLEQSVVTGFEALLRWHHPELGLVPPDRLIGHAEESGQIVPIGFWVIEQACRQARRWLDDGVAFGHVSVNVSGAQLQDGFSEQVAQLLDDAGLPAHMLEMEVTETFIMRGLKQPVEQLGRLHRLGVCLAVDDFGVGHSSLSQLKRLPTRRLKIDRSFVGELVDDSDDRAIVEAMVSLGSVLGLDVAAKGVESAGQHTLLRDLGCRYAQGYYYATPAPARDLPSQISDLEARLVGR